MSFKNCDLASSSTSGESRKQEAILNDDLVSLRKRLWLEHSSSVFHASPVPVLINL